MEEDWSEPEPMKPTPPTKKQASAPQRAGQSVKESRSSMVSVVSAWPLPWNASVVFRMMLRSERVTCMGEGTMPTVPSASML
ncbi:hypothetical protein TRAPUB_5257 [Trametes pubescens]|uniref:Uncharacterized protein n=1 Tax=Trametes pubescens TaxID=154538 RepID=A0A1M2V8S8_TRAPU|nr:hypothetical protein TRAPUB_5257 [Trametes pubescens]